jgi:hypothetical protein
VTAPNGTPKHDNALSVAVALGDVAKARLLSPCPCTNTAAIALALLCGHRGMLTALRPDSRSFIWACDALGLGYCEPRNGTKTVELLAWLRRRTGSFCHGVALASMVVLFDSLFARYGRHTVRGGHMAVWHDCQAEPVEERLKRRMHDRSALCELAHYYHDPEPLVDFPREYMSAGYTLNDIWRGLTLDPACAMWMSPNDHARVSRRWVLASGTWDARLTVKQERRAEQARRILYGRGSATPRERCSIRSAARHDCPPSRCDTRESNSRHPRQPVHADKRAYAHSERKTHGHRCAGLAPFTAYRRKRD